MNKIPVILGSLIVMLGVAAWSQADAQSAPLAYTLQRDPDIPSTTTQRQQNEVMRLMGAHLGIWLAPDRGRYPIEQLVTEDAVFEYPYADDASLRRIEGRAAVAAALRRLPLEATDWTFSDMKLFETPHPDIFFVAYRAKAYVPETRRMYEQVFLARVTVRDGKIAGYYELWDRDARSVAFGTGGQKKPS
ncbi:MAG TPA: nuclear transport factor 2 family protein [Burkholderiales bacterium]|nr:nuclear transport factor 2 family protein [Burkholderiales bacterium]